MDTPRRSERGTVTNALARLVPNTAPAAGDGSDEDPVRAERRALTNGFGDALAKAFEMVATPAVFGFLGWLLDRWLGTQPLFLLVFVIVVFVYEVWKVFLGYGTAMAEHEAKLLRRPRADERR